MLSFPSGIQVHMAVEPVDMRKSFDGLSAAVEAVFARRVLDGPLFLFFNKRRDRIKLLWWDGDGLSVLRSVSNEARTRCHGTLPTRSRGGSTPRSSRFFW